MMLYPVQPLYYVEFINDRLLGILFILYINDIIRSSAILKFIMFADSTNLSYSRSNFAALFDTINAELINVANCIKIYKVPLN